MKRVLIHHLTYGLLIVGISACGRSNTVNVESSITQTATVATTVSQPKTATPTPTLSNRGVDGTPTVTATIPSLSEIVVRPTRNAVLEATAIPTTIQARPVITPLPTVLHDIAPDLPPNPEGAVMGEVPPAIMSKIMDDVMQRTGAARTAIVEVVGVFTTWNDGSLGCPQPGMAYTQASVDGYHVILQVRETRYDYRVSDRGSFFLCSSQPSSSPPSQGETDQFLIYGQIIPAEELSTGDQTPKQHRERVIQAATEHLAARIGVESAAVTLGAIQEKEIVITAPCGEDYKENQGMQGLGLGFGYEVVLQVNATQYRYVATATIGYYCGEI